MLRLDKVSTEYDRVPMLRELSLRIEKGKVVCLLGSNGAGKTTTVKTILGLVKPIGGDILFEDRSIRGLKTDQIVERGISVVPEGRRLFPKMTVHENLMIGAASVNDKVELRKRLEGVFFLFPAIRDRMGQAAGTLSGGEQGMVAIGRGIMSNPKILLLDEPSLGLSPKLVDEFFQTIARINKKQGTTVLLIEQHATKALSIADNGYILQKGRIIAEGTCGDLMEMDVVKNAYLKTSRGNGR
ncbi:MAG: ABC transporter ATP-binding protein [Desulfobacterales bacterium]|nr:ABC transporter ATP-binding protein [Desulfobacterales bacterium]